MCILRRRRNLLLLLYIFFLSAKLSKKSFFGLNLELSPTCFFFVLFFLRDMHKMYNFGQLCVVCLIYLLFLFLFLYFCMFFREGNSSDDGVIAAQNREICSICQSTIKPGDRIKFLPCLHKFHSNEIDRWLAQSDLCPICKRSIV